MDIDEIMSVVSELSTVCFMNDRGDDEVIQIWRSIRMQQMGWMEKEYDEALNAAARTRIWVYLLVSSKGRKFVGKTKHPIRYLKEHNSGKTKSTKPSDGEECGLKSRSSDRCTMEGCLHAQEVHQVWLKWLGPAAEDKSCVGPRNQ